MSNNNILVLYYKYWWEENVRWEDYGTSLAAKCSIASLNGRHVQSRSCLYEK